MKSKKQKKVELDESLKKLDSSKTVLLTDFTGVPTKDIVGLKKNLKNLESEYKVVKKRLLRIAFEKKGIKINPEDFEAQVGIIYSNKELLDIASPIFKSMKTSENFKVLGGFNFDKNEILSADFIKEISSLPSREILLGRLVGMIAAPLKMFMFILNEQAKKI
ncbi:MAG: 50S ribosomal protein L10 [Candidatus Pacebacteria bacterium]|nr:50S ribosomal protein L10 [Candidatus Paceibacterota bacterium]